MILKLIVMTRRMIHSSPCSLIESFWGFKYECWKPYEQESDNAANQYHSYGAASMPTEFVLHVANFMPTRNMAVSPSNSNELFPKIKQMEAAVQGSWVGRIEIEVELKLIK